MESDALITLFAQTAAAVSEALLPVLGAGLSGSSGGFNRRARTEVPGQYQIDLVADAAALSVLHGAPVAVLSEESGWTGRNGAAITVVVDPVDGSTNASRGVPYYGTSLCALDGDGALAALVVNHATGVTTTAIRGAGTLRDGHPVSPSAVVRVGESMVALAGNPPRWLEWRQYRSLGSVALALCDLAAGVLEGFVDGASHHAPWDYLGGMLACTEAGAVIVDVEGRDLAVADPDARRQLLAAANPALFDDLQRSLWP